MKGLDIKIIQDNKGLVIDNLSQSKGVEFKIVEFKGKRLSLDNADVIEKFVIGKNDFITMAEVFNKHAEILKNDNEEKELATVKFFEEREKKEGKKK